MNTTESIVIAAHPDALGKIGGDVGNITDRVPAIEASHLEGDVRHARFAGGGGDAVERITRRGREVVRLRCFRGARAVPVPCTTGLHEEERMTPTVPPSLGGPTAGPDGSADDDPAGVTLLRHLVRRGG